MWTRGDPLDEWQELEEYDPPVVDQQESKEARQLLEDLERQLDALEGSTVDYSRVPRHTLESPRVLLRATDAQRAARLCLKVATTGGTKSLDMQRSLLDVVGRVAEPAALPHLVELLGFARPRERFAGERRALTLAAMARVAIVHPDSNATELLAAATKHTHAGTRAVAAKYLARVYTERRSSAPAESAGLLRELATREPSLQARYAARKALRSVDLAVPNDAPEGSYVFKVWLRGSAKVSRTVEVSALQDLDDLHRAIQDAFDWDDDHLYFFCLDTKPNCSEYMLTGPFLDGDESSVPTSSFPLGELGLHTGDRFVYLFDMGDQHLFEIGVLDVRQRAGGGDLPRVLESVGEAPAQYPPCDGW